MLLCFVDVTNRAYQTSQPPNDGNVAVQHVMLELLSDPTNIPLLYDPYSALFLAAPVTFCAAWHEWLGPLLFEHYPVCPLNPPVWHGLSTIHSE